MKFEGWFNSCAETQLLVNHKKTTLKINWNFILCLLGVRLHHISILGLFFISFAWGSNSRFNSALETQLLVNHKQKTLESIETSYFVYWGWNRTIYIYIYIYIKFELILILFSWGFNLRFNSAAKTQLHWKV